MRRTTKVRLDLQCTNFFAGMDDNGEDGYYKGPKRSEEDGGRPLWGDHYPQVSCKPPQGDGLQGIEF